MSYAVHTKMFKCDPHEVETLVQEELKALVDERHRHGEHPVSLSHTFWRKGPRTYCHVVLVTIEPAVP